MKDSKYSYGLMTDLYELTMAAGYFTHHCEQSASFELFVRRLPVARNYLLVAGIESALNYLADLRFTNQEIDYLHGLTVFQNVGKEFFEYLREFRFTGDVWAMPEGTLAFADEPILRVTAPIIQAQIVETYLLTEINFQTMIATKASRVVKAAREDDKERPVFEFGARRAHGSVAGVWAARSAYLGGCAGTSDMAAGIQFDIPVFGTAAHSWTLAFDSEPEAFEKFYQVFPHTCTLLIDTYDTLDGAEHAARIGPGLKGVRIDSGNMLEDSKKVRKILDQAGLQNTKIVASGDLNEYKISELIRNGAPIDVFGVGTDLSTSRDAPALGGIYKMVERTSADGVRHFTAKFSHNKFTWPGNKQVFRHYDDENVYQGDTIGLAEEIAPTQSAPLLVEMVQSGKRIMFDDLETARKRAALELTRLEEKYQRLNSPAQYPVRHSTALEKLLEQVKKETMAKAASR
ncbi:MAG: nicotinate phosphoribosyltransferase [Acidobacteriota bacterium]